MDSVAWRANGVRSRVLVLLFYPSRCCSVARLLVGLGQSTEKRISYENRCNFSLQRCYKEM